MIKFEFFQDSSGQWRWRLKARNGRIVADSGEGYSTRGSVMRAMANLQDMLAEGTLISVVEVSS